MEDYKSIYKIYPYNKSIELFYYYAKNKVKFKQSVNQFVDEFEKKGVEPKHFEELLDFSLKLLRKFDESLNNKISDKDISQLYKVYEDLGSKRIVGDITRKLNWINPMAKFLLNNIHDVVGFLYLHEKEFDKFRKDPNHLKKRTEILNKRKHPFECNLKNWKEVHKNKQK